MIRDSAYQYDPDKARELLRQAGYENGLNLNCSPTRTTPLQSHGSASGGGAQRFSQSGIRARITGGMGTLLDRTLSHHYQMAMLGWITDNGDPDN